MASNINNIAISFEDHRVRSEGTSTDGHIIHDDGHRSAQFHRLCAHFKIDRTVSVDLTSVASTEALRETLKEAHNNNDNTQTLLPRGIFEAPLVGSHEFSFYVTTSCADYRLLHEAIAIAAAELRTQATQADNGPISVRVILVEDLVYVQRPYIFQNKERNFFRNMQRFFDEQRDGTLSFSIVSSQELMNRWGEGDVRIVRLPWLCEDTELRWTHFLREVDFHEMYNQGNKVPRLIAIQSIAGEEGRPLYRHPNDEEPPNVEMQPLVRTLMEHVERETDVTGLNHVLIQLYRDGRDNIAQHSDKTLDIDRNTPILNVSLGCTRTMHIQHKREKHRIECIPLRTGECVVFGLESNKHWYHEVPKDVTMPSHEVFGTNRISFTFRRIATFAHGEHGVLIGQGSPFKTLKDYNRCAASIASGHIVEEVFPRKDRSDLIMAFSKENKQSEEFDWEATYGAGFW